VKNRRNGFNKGYGVLEKSTLLSQLMIFLIDHNYLKFFIVMLKPICNLNIFLDYIN
jgi:hypothetical protein